MANEITLTIADTAKALHVSRPTVYAEIQAGRLKTFTIGRRRFVSADALRDYVKAREGEAA